MAGWRSKRASFAHVPAHASHALPTHAFQAARGPGCHAAGVLHEKQTEGELGELLRRLQGAQLEGELDEYELVGLSTAPRGAGRHRAACLPCKGLKAAGARPSRPWAAGPGLVVLSTRCACPAAQPLP